MDIRSMFQRLLGRSEPESETPPPPDRGDLEETKSIEETLDEIKEEQTPETGRGLP